MWSPAAESRGALVIPMGTMESTKDKGWTWILGAPIEEVRKAGVHFDPNARTAKTIQGDAESSSALEVLHAMPWTPMACVITSTSLPGNARYLLVT